MSKSSLDSILEVSQDDFLKVLYEYRNNEGGVITPEFKEKLKTIKEQKKQKYSRLIQKIKENLKDESSIEEIELHIQEFIEACNNEDGYYQEQYYDTGLTDGIKLMLQCFKQN